MPSYSKSFKKLAVKKGLRSKKNNDFENKRVRIANTYGKKGKSYFFNIQSDYNCLDYNINLKSDVQYQTNNCDSQLPFNRDNEYIHK